MQPTASLRNRVSLRLKFLIGGLVFLVALMAALINERLNEKPFRKQGMAITKLKSSSLSRHQTLAWWSSQEVTSIINAESRGNVVDMVAIKFDQNAVENDRQATESRIALRRFLDAYVGGRYEDYREFVTPVDDVAPLKSITAAYGEALTRLGIKQTLELDDDESIRRQFWYGSKGEMAPRYSSYITGVAAAASELCIIRHSTVPRDAVIVEWTAMKRPSIGLGAMRRSYDIKPHPTDALADAGTLDLLEIYLVVTSKQASQPTGLSIWHYWSTKYQKWIPMSLIVLSMERDQLQLMF